MARGRAPRIRSLALAASALVLLLGTRADGWVKDPFDGDAFIALVTAQNVPLQQLVEGVVPETEGFHVTGPLDIFFAGPERARAPFDRVRVICPDVDALERAVALFEDDPRRRKVERHIDKPRKRDPAGFRGVVVTLRIDGDDQMVQLNTVQQTRWLIWLRNVAARRTEAALGSKDFASYAIAVSDHLHALDRGKPSEPPAASDYRLPPADDLYAPRPEYVIQGYDNYMDFLHDYEELRVDFARGITAFVPGDSLMDAFKSIRPERAYPNKEEPMLQHEYRKFFSRGGDARVIRTLTADALGSLQPGEYFFAVGLSGKIRVGYEMPRKEVDRVERETGKKLARANHAFLFPGEPVLTAGALWVAGDGETRHIEHVNAHSGHYFYSNVTETIREDIAVRSDDYLLTLGHFFAALDEQGISYHRILISKM